ncbi:MAG: pteridine-dependent deoxygenase [Thermomonas sp.]
MNAAHNLHAGAKAQLAVDYVQTDHPAELLADNRVLAVFGFGTATPAQLNDPRYLHVPLQPHQDTRTYEVWRGNGPVVSGRADGVAWASDGQLTFGAIEVDEREFASAAEPTGIVGAAAHAYARITAFQRDCDTPYLLRIWNYLDAITQGDGDIERYRQFCIGRARGFGDFDPTRLPAATAIGRCDDARVLQVYWLAARAPGTPLENPRQVEAWRYPRQYGPQPPSFARAMLPPTADRAPLLLSGTASVVGHATRHAGLLLEQLGETFANFDALIAEARKQQPGLPGAFDESSRLKVYVRDQADLPLVANALKARLGSDVPFLLLHAAICRRDLAIEIDGVHGSPASSRLD